jgi:hypothetical protein
MEFGARTQLSRSISDVSTTFPLLCASSDRISLRADPSGRVDLIMVLINVLDAEVRAFFSRFPRSLRVATRLTHSKATTSTPIAA